MPITVAPNRFALRVTQAHDASLRILQTQEDAWRGDSQLNEQESESARGGVYEDILPLLDLMRLFHKRQSRQPLHEHRSRIARREPVEQFHRLGRIGERVLGKAAPGRVSRDFVADFEAVGGFVDALTDGDDFSRALVSENVRQRDFVNSSALIPARVRSALVRPHPDGHEGGVTQRIDKVVPGVFNANEDLTRARSWDFNLSDLDHANVALFEDLSGAHLGRDLLMGGRHGAADLGEAGLSDSWRRRRQCG